MQYNILYCDSRGSRLLDCVTTQARDTASQVAIRHGQAWGMQADAWGMQASTRGARADARGARAGAQGAQAGRTACVCLGVLLASRLCTWCTQPVFDLV